MLYVGLTGNIASGKSEVTRLLQERGATIIDADVLAREAVLPETMAFRRIVERWGDRVVASDGTLDRGALRRIVFEDRAQLDELNAIVHPEVAALRDARIAEATARGDKIVVYAVPLLFEANMADEFDRIVLVDAPTNVRLQRLIRTRGLDATEALNMITAQMPAEIKRVRADFVIENSGTLEELERQVELLWAWLLDAEDGVASSNV
jgi:dephospho-CoA kinase